MLDLFTVVWGDINNTYVKFYQEVGLPSLMQPGNIPAAKDLIGKYYFYSDDAARKAIIANKFYREMEALIEVVWQPIVKGAWWVNPSILEQMKVSQGKNMFLVIPDWCFGNGSILNMAKLCAKDKYSLILFSFTKIPSNGFAEMREVLKSGGIVSNKRLVSVASRLEATTIWPDEYVGPVGGALRKLGPQTWLMYHRCPAQCLKPDNRLIDFFATNPTPNRGYDHVLPYWMIINRYPYKYIDHSDFFFVVELALGWKGEPGEFWEEKLWGEADQFFSQFRQIWQGEE